MKIRRLEINNQYVGKIAVADSYFLRLRGMIGRRFDDFGFIQITPCSEIHTFMMSYPIDVIYLDRGNRIIDFDVHADRNRIFRPVKHARSVIECPAGCVDALNIRKSYVINIED